MKRFSLFLLLTLVTMACLHADDYVYKTFSYGLHFHLKHNSSNANIAELYSVKIYTKIAEREGRIDIIIPDSILVKGKTYYVTGISNKALNDNVSYVTTVVIPRTVTTIKKNTFSHCTNLTAIAIPNTITSIGKHAFHGTKWYNQLPDGAIYINNMLYAYKGKIPRHRTITIKEGTTKILEGAFQDCKTLTAISLPQSLKEIGKDAFNGCSSLKSIALPKNIERIASGCFANCTSLVSVSLPDGLLHICSDAFTNCTSLTSLVIPASVHTIGGEVTQKQSFHQAKDGTIYITHNRFTNPAFKNCSSLVSVTISEGVRCIDNNAFEGCTALRTIRIPNSVYSIGAEAFKDCNALTEIQFGDSLRYVGYKAFHTTPWYENLPDGEVYIGKTLYAYKGEMLTPTAIKIQDSTITIAKGAFAGYNQLTDIRFPNTLETIEDSAFYGCSALSTILLPNSLQEVGWEAFKNCSSLDSIRLSDSLTNVGWKAFHGTPRYDKQADDGVVYINDIAYSYKGSMPENTSAELREGTKFVAAGAFANQSNLTTIIIPQTLQKINSYAFYKCKSLNSITCMGTLPPLCEQLVFTGKMFPGDPIEQICIYVPENAVKKYKKNINWKRFTKILPLSKKPNE